MPADVRVEKERALAGYQADLEKSKSEVGSKRRNDIISRYHMVRFFERQKATRILKKLRAKVSATSPASPEHKSLEVEIHKAEVDLNYTMYFPLLEKYQSLYPRTEEQGPLDEASGKDLSGNGEGPERHPIWYIVERAMVDDTLKELRDGGGKTMALGMSRPRLSNNSRRESSGIKDAQRRGGGVKLTGGPCSDREDEDDDDDDDNMSDGGFFEE